jgi:hypothetical protein
MSAGSGASNLGYGETALNSNINGNLVNVDSSTYSGGFSSNEMPPRGLPGISSSVLAANASKIGGGRRRRKRNMSRKCSCCGQVKTMKGGRRRSLRKKRSIRRRRRTQRGGTPYAQFHGGIGESANYSLGGVNLGASNSALANPPIIGGTYNNCPNAYNHYTGSRGD